MTTPTHHSNLLAVVGWIAANWHFISALGGAILTWLLPSPLKKKRPNMDLLAKLNLVSLFAPAIANVEDPNGFVHQGVKAAAAAFGNDMEKKLAADDDLWAKTVRFIKDGVELEQAIAKDLAQ